MISRTSRRVTDIVRAMVFLVASTASAGRLTAQLSRPAADPEEAFLSFRYAGLAETVITAVYVADSVYLPMEALFGRLRLEYAYEPAARVGRGFFIHPERRYELDFVRLRVHRARERDVILLDPRDFVIAADQAYVLPSLLERIFGLDVNVDLSELTLRITSPEPLPIDRSLERERRRARPALPEILQPPAPLRFPRNRHLFNGGALQYALSAAGVDQGSLYSLDLAGAAELGGGDLQASYRSWFGSSGEGVPEFEARWRYVFGDDTRLIQQVQVGSLTGRALHSFEVTGIRITNEPVNPRVSLGTYLLVGETGPHWEVELYLNGELVNYGGADERGRFQFQLPLSYGGSLISLKYYGPKGEVVVDERRLDVPPAFVPAGTLDYDLSAGRMETLDRNLVQGRVHYGLTNWLTAGIGVEHVDQSGRRPAVLQTTAIRLPQSITLGLESAPGYLYRGTIQGAFPSLAHFFASATRAERDSIYNPTGARERLSARAFVPARVFGAPVGVSVAAGRAKYWTGGRTDDIDGDVLLNLPRVKPSIGYTGSRFVEHGRGLLLTHRLNLGLFLAPATARSRGLVGDLLFNCTAEQDLSRRAWDYLRCEASTAASSTGRVALSLEHFARLNENRLEMRYQLDLPTMRSTTSARTGRAGTFVSQAVRGAVVVDPRYGHVGISRLEQVGRAGATFRMFFDDNGDGVFGPGEPIIKGGGVRFRHAASIKSTSSGVLRAEDLLPYHRYSVRVETTQLPNPLWLPQFESFSFVSDPNSFKAIDIPFYAGAVVEGQVRDSAQGAMGKGIAGLRVHLRRLDGSFSQTVETFADGSFYVMGLPPGEYEAAADEAQVRAAGRLMEPRSRRFTVRATSEGDAVTGIDFTLRADRTARPDRPSPR